MPGKIFPMTPPAPRSSRVTVEREAVHAAAAFLAGSIVERRNTVPILSNIVMQADAAAGTLSLRGTDLDIQATLTIPAAVDAAGGGFTVDAAAFADAVKKAPKGAQVTVAHDVDTGRVSVIYGRARMTLPTLPVDDFPALAPLDLDASPVDVGEFAADLARLVPFMGKGDRYYLSGVQFAATAAGVLQMTASDGGTLARITRPVPAGLDGLESAILPRKAVAVLAKVLRKRDGWAGLAFTSGRAMFAMPGLRIDSKLVDGTFPDVAPFFDALANAQRVAFVDLEPTLSPSVLETYRKAMGVAPDVATDGALYAFTAAAVPEFYGIATHCRDGGNARYSYGHEGGADAVAYMSGLADRRGFDLAPFHAAALAFGEAEAAAYRERYPSHDWSPTPPPAVRLETARGVVLGATFGHVIRGAVKAGDVIGTRPATAEELDAIETGDGRRGFSGPGARAMLEREGVDVRAESDMPAQYVDGAFSIPMPRERAEAVHSAVRFEAEDGTTYPLRSATGANGVTAAIELSAEAVRRLCGDVDPSTHRDIPATVFYRGEALEPGWMLPTPPKLAKGAGLRMTAAETRAYLDACRPVYVGAPDVPAAEPVAAMTTAETVAAVTSGAWDAAEPLDVPGEAVEAVEAIAAPSPDVDALAARLAALEAVVARLSRPVVAGKRQRSEAERRAILRAWKMRREMREAREERDDYRGRFMAACRQRADAGRDRQQMMEERDALSVRLRDLEALERANARYAGEALAAAAAADRRAARMVRAAAGHRTARRRLADDLRGSQAEARALARRLDAAASPGRSRVPASPIAPTAAPLAA